MIHTLTKVYNMASDLPSFFQENESFITIPKKIMLTTDSAKASMLGKQRK